MHPFTTMSNIYMLKKSNISMILNVPRQSLALSKLSLEEGAGQGVYETLGNKLVNSLARVVVIVPYAGSSVGVGAGDIGVETICGRVIKDLPEVGGRVEYLAQGDVGVVGLELLHVADELGVV